jgi:hypothetical protein
MKNQLFSIVALTAFVFLSNALPAQSLKEALKYQGVYIHDLNYGGATNDGIFLFEQDVFGLLEIIEKTFLEENIPIIQGFASYHCAHLQCFVFHDLERNRLGIELLDCHDELLLSLSAPNYVRFPIGINEIPRKRAPMQSALKQALNDREKLRTLFGLKPEEPRQENRKEKHLEGEDDYAPERRDPLEGSYSLLSFEFPENSIEIEKREGVYVILKKTGVGEKDGQVLGEFSRHVNAEYEGFWKLDNRDDLAFRLKFKSNGNIILFFDRHFKKRIKFEKR